MKILSIGYHTIHRSGYSVNRVNGSEDYMLMLTFNPCVFEFADKEIYAEPDSVVLYNKNIPQIFHSDEPYFVYDWICFDTEGDQEFLKSLNIAENTVLRYNDTEFISDLIKNMYSEFYSCSSNRTKMLDVMLKTILMKISESTELTETQKQNTDPHYNELLELRDKIYSNPQIKWTVELMAGEVKMSRSYFQHIYSEIFGISCISDVINCKIEKAKEILSTSQATISQVASMCGYDNEEHFMRQFKKMTGVTPTVYRKNNI
ncbi:MAG: helix-turn-helix domain-containing protein [Ruminococcus sp.]|nr:helix-turn-helix domain-containing protein [Ruminococcus sp.]